LALFIAPIQTKCHAADLVLTPAFRAMKFSSGIRRTHAAHIGERRSVADRELLEDMMQVNLDGSF
jgi:hypothetical protein